MKIEIMIIKQIQIKKIIMKIQKFKFIPEFIIISNFFDTVSMNVQPF